MGKFIWMKNFFSKTPKTTTSEDGVCAHKIRKNTVLICEPNSCHSEVIVGYAKYLLDMGYNIDVLMTKENTKQKAFHRFKNKKICFMETSEPLKHGIFKSEKIKNYSFVLFTTTIFFSSNKSVIDALGHAPNGKCKTLLVEHDQLRIKSLGLEKELENGQIITLGTFPGCVMINPHYFGDVKITPLNKITRFICVGGIESARKNHNLLLDAVHHLAQQRAEFKIVIIGSGDAIGLPDEIKPYIEFKGKLNFPDMYDEMERADFFLPLLDPGNLNHERYITTGITGSAQLIYGFGKPCIINKKFADFYRFNGDNSILYDGDNLGDAMMAAIDLGPDKYDLMQKNLLITAKSIYKESLNNFKELINKGKCAADCKIRNIF